MTWILETEEKSSVSPRQHPSSLFPPPPPPPPPPPSPIAHSSSALSFNSNKVSPSVLLIIIVLAIIFFISGLLHLLVRFLIKPQNRDSDDELENGSALQGQLQQLFHLHDAGVDQSFIDTLPIFHYKAIIGVKDPFDCAVCLCEFDGEDKLRLLPKCSHAFHMECIDTWLLSHSTCPLCRSVLISDFSPNHSPRVLVLESGSESSRDIVQENGFASANSVAMVNSHLSSHCNDCNDDDLRVEKSGEIQEKQDGCKKDFVGCGEKVVTVKLGKFRNVDGDVTSSSSSCNDNGDQRRCFSMGSFAYVMDENTSLQVPITRKKESKKKQSLPLTPGHRLALSECGCDSRREFNGFEAFKVVQNSDGNDRKVIGRSKRDSFSVSKIWLRGKKEKSNSSAEESSRRAFSFRFAAITAGSGSNGVGGGGGGGSSGGGGGGGGGGGASEVDMSELGYEENPPSFARRTLLWLMGTQNRVAQSASMYNV